MNYLYNKSLNNNSIPTEWKTSIIKPIYKNKGKKTEMSNYRPISLTPHFVKIMERIIINKISDCLENNLFSKDQHGFRKNHSTTTALIIQQTDIINQADSKIPTDTIFFDLSKAFDQINHEILAKKISKSEIPLVIQNWIINFFTFRKFSIQINNYVTDTKTINRGVPQGSIIAPILFNIFTADLPS
ncbi:Uncharacterised protein at_DN1801, partial [Pycnogonum litorale]